MVDKKFEHLTHKEKSDMLKKTLSLLDFTPEGARKRGMFFLTSMKTFNLVLSHNQFEIFTFFEPNIFCSALALAREVSFYITMFIRDRETLEAISARPSKSKEDLELVLSILKELFKMFIARLKYKELNEQSKEFKNTYIIDCIFMLFEAHHKPHIMPNIDPVLLNSLFILAQSLFQLICSLVGSFDFLIKYILERVLTNSLNEAVYLRIFGFCLRACYPTEGRKKFLELIKTTLVEIKAKDLKPLQNELHIHYGSDPLINTILTLKETYKTYQISNCLEYIIFRGLSIRDHERKLALIEVLNALAKFGETRILINIRTFITLRIGKEEETLRSSGRATRELSNILELMTHLTLNPFYKAAFLQDDILKVLNSILKHLLANKIREAEFPILRLIQNLLQFRICLNNSKEEERKRFDGIIDKIHKSHVMDLASILGDNLAFEGASDSNFEEESYRVKTQTAIIKTTHMIFDANYTESVCLKEFSKGDDSKLYFFIRNLISFLVSSKFTHLIAAFKQEYEELLLNLMQMLISLVLPGNLTEETYRSKRMKNIALLVGNDKDVEKAKDLVRDLVEASARHFEAGSDTVTGRKCLYELFTEVVNKKEQQLLEMVKVFPKFKEGEISIKKEYYETPFERDYKLEWDDDKKMPEFVKEIIHAFNNLSNQKIVKYADIHETPGKKALLEFTFESTTDTVQDATQRPASQPPKFVESKTE